MAIRRVLLAAGLMMALANPVLADLIYVSASGSGTAICAMCQEDVPFEDEDILVYDTERDIWRMHF